MCIATILMTCSNSELNQVSSVKVIPGGLGERGVRVRQHSGKQKSTNKWEKIYQKMTIPAGEHSVHHGTQSGYRNTYSSSSSSPFDRDTMTQPLGSSSTT